MGVRRQMLLCPLLLVFLTLAKHSEGWSWRCENKRCVRSLSPDPETVLGSLEVCRLTCQPYGSIWPQPTGSTNISDKVAHIHPSKVSFDYSSVAYFSRPVVSDFMTAISRVFVSNMWQMCGANCSEAVDTSSVTVTIDTASADLTVNWTTDESYSLEVTSSTGGQVAAYIRANTVFGARHGLETLSQLMTLVQTTGTNQLVMLATATVNDKPVYPHRGLLLDTARNFLPLSAIKRSVDAMAACKLNVLHWHATDSQSFPLNLPRVPQLARYGAYSAEEVYTMEDMDMIMKYARERGIRIVLELDMPAHAGNGWQWGPEAGLGTLAVCVNQQPWRQFCLQPPCGQLNPANPALYRVLRDVFRDLADHLPDNEALHMGGDEVFFPCWSQSQEVTDWMKSLGLGVSQADFLTVWGEFHKKVLQVWDQVVGHNKSPVLLWTSHLTDPDVISKYLDKDRFVIEAWTDEKDPKVDRLLAMGYRLIMATQDAWYLDHGFWGGMKYYNWRRVYDNRLSRAPGVLGGEVAMWGELVDEHNLDSRVWPRATAAAERLWSDPSHSSSDAEDRLVTQRERLVWRGVRPETITPQWCAHNTGLCLGSANTS